LNVESERLDAFSADDVPYVEGLAAQLAQAIENARLAARSRELAAAEERARIARDLHDETIQALVAIGRQLDLLELDLAEPDRARARVESLHDLVDRTRDGVRRLSRNLRPAVLEDLGLRAALESHVQDMAALGLSVELEMRGDTGRLAPAVEYALFRVAQEALSNVLRHAQVARAELELDVTGEELVMTVTDRGAGTAAPRKHADDGGRGLQGMRDRAAEIGATLDIESRRGVGTTVRLRLPLTLTMLDGG
jgi:two-component system sensor histidine kinase UhpB